MTTLQLISDLMLAGGLIVLACGSMLCRNLTRCVVLFMSFGLLMAFSWARLDAPDIALVEVCIGSGLTGALLLSTISFLDRAARRNEAGGN